ncbi:ABC transporter permease [Hydrogenibacillus schlegelii]|nr:ABC transporter permease [Hydrogenibacillus schlegelii]
MPGDEAGGGGGRRPFVRAAARLRPTRRATARLRPEGRAGGASGRFRWEAAASLGALMLGWEGAVRAFHVPAWLLPAPSAVVRAFWAERTVLLDHAAATVTEAAAGLGLAALLAVAVATAMAFFAAVRAALYPLLVVSQTVPIIALAPLVIVWFGYGMLPKVLVVALVTFFPLAVSLAEGYRTADPRRLALLRTMGGGRWAAFRYVLWPSALPSFFAGLRIAATYSVTGAVIGEWLGATKGLGVYLIRASKSFAIERLFAAIAVIVGVSLLFFAAAEFMARLSLRGGPTMDAAER